MTATSIRPWYLALALAAAALLCTAPVAAQESAPEKDGANAAVRKAPGKQRLILSGDTPDLFLLYTGDVIGYLDPCG